MLAVCDIMTLLCFASACVSILMATVFGIIIAVSADNKLYTHTIICLFMGVGLMMLSYIAHAVGLAYIY